MKPRLFIVERKTQKRRNAYVEVVCYVVMASSGEEACTIAQAECPQDELDGPTVDWTAEEEGTPIVRIGTQTRRAARRSS